MQDVARFAMFPVPSLRQFTYLIWQESRSTGPSMRMTQNTYPSASTMQKMACCCAEIVNGYFDNKPQRLMHIKSNGTIELTGKAKEQKYGPGGACLHGKKVPWADKINKKDWPTSALLHVVYHLKAKSRKRKAFGPGYR